MSKARELANLGNAYSDGALSNRNLLINSAMQVAQRGTSFTANGYGLDRWLVQSNGTPPTVTQQSDVFSVGGKSLKMVTDASSAYAYFSQRVEDLSYFSGKTITVSFDYKATSDFYVQFEYNYGSGGSASEASKHINLVSSSASTARGVITVTIDDLSSKTFGPSNTSHLSLLFNSEVANPTTVEITNVQLEVGDTATPFEHRSYGDELARCQRYYQQIDYSRYSYLAPAKLQVNYLIGPIQGFDAQIMRSNPTGSFSTDTGAAFTVARVNIGGSHTPADMYVSKTGVVFLRGGSTFTNTTMDLLEFNSGSGVVGSIKLDAEL